MTFMLTYTFNVRHACCDIGTSFFSISGSSDEPLQTFHNQCTVLAKTLVNLTPVVNAGLSPYNR